MKKIIGKFTKQRWVGMSQDRAEDLETVEFDATDCILRMSLKDIHALRDNQDNTSAIGHAHVRHSGPDETEIVDSILEFFDLGDSGQLVDITDLKLTSAVWEWETTPRTSWTVEICRTSVSHRHIVVAARTEAEAMRIAENRAGGVSGYVESEAEYEAISANEALKEIE